MILFAGLLVVATAVVAILKKADVRLALLAAALALGALAGQPMLIVRTFFGTLCSEQFFVPIGCAVGFAYVLRHTGCEQHLVQLLVKPLRSIRFLLVPGVVLVGFAVNCPVVSQVGTAVSIGAVLVPLLRAARVSPVTSGSALLLGCSLGGDLLNPGAPEWGTVADVLRIDNRDCVGRVLPLLLLQLAVATPVFWLLSHRADAAGVKGDVTHDDEAAAEPEFRVNYLKAIVPLVPLALLFLAGPPLRAFDVPKGWLVDTSIPGEVAKFASRQIGAAMLIGVVLAALTAPPAGRATARVFFEGAGYAMTHIISLIVAAACFGKGVEGIGVKGLLGEAIGGRPGLLLPAAGALPLAFGCLCGSGMATTQALFAFFVGPAGDAGVDPVLVGAVVAVAASAGRTMSPVAAIVLMSGRLTDTDPLALVRRVVVPLLLGTAAVVGAAAVLAARG